MGKGGFGERRGGRGGGRGGNIFSELSSWAIGRNIGRSGGFQQGPPSEVVAVGSFISACEGEMVCKLDNPKVPFFNAPIYLKDKTMIGKLDEILGSLTDSYFTVKMQDGNTANQFKKDDKVYISTDKLLPMERFLPKPKVVGKVSKPTGLQGLVEKKQKSFDAGFGGRGGARGGRGGSRGGGRGGSRGGFRGATGGRGGRGGGRDGFNNGGGRGGFNNGGGRGGFNNGGGRGGFNNGGGRGGFNNGGFNNNRSSSQHTTF
ncbi:Gar1/Naf1 RNA binding region-domain-containing protein [Mycotypha africana]|uniref:Gar1/Naf1 RNA binding region-domain-containing protein n=1 Tax=Mycotypha africana TaxID=64632 RepID=UPI002301F493|nr:Gar1/Naf1 RNA binding region-domain-containing protein [Mycotypha africana]KAI8987864.1 Gar1/Naf1 RNA binding region-domain-containing protein [Mycotypha africana]